MDGRTSASRYSPCELCGRLQSRLDVLQYRLGEPLDIPRYSMYNEGIDYLGIFIWERRKENG